MQNNNEKKGEFQRLIRATKYSFDGLYATLQNEAAFRTEVILIIFLAPLASWLGKTGVERALMVGSLLLVLVVEVVNSSIEAVVDRVGTEHHTLAGRAKDMGSAAVFLALVNVVMVWLLVLL